MQHSNLMIVVVNDPENDAVLVLTIATDKLKHGQSIESNVLRLEEPLDWYPIRAFVERHLHRAPDVIVFGDPVCKFAPRVFAYLRSQFGDAVGFRGTMRVEQLLIDTVPPVIDMVRELARLVEPQRAEAAGV